MAIKKSGDEYRLPRNPTVIDVFHLHFRMFDTNAKEFLEKHNLSRQTLSVWRKSNKIPRDRLYDFNKEYGSGSAFQQWAMHLIAEQGKRLQKSADATLASANNIPGLDQGIGALGGILDNALITQRYGYPNLRIPQPQPDLDEVDIIRVPKHGVFRSPTEKGGLLYAHFTGTQDPDVIKTSAGGQRKFTYIDESVVYQEIPLPAIWSERQGKVNPVLNTAKSQAFSMAASKAQDERPDRKYIACLIAKRSELIDHPSVNSFSKDMESLGIDVIVTKEGELTEQDIIMLIAQFTTPAPQKVIAKIKENEVSEENESDLSE